MLPGMRTDVVVVGAGPTGLMLATELGLAGAEVAVVERQAAPSGQSRGGGVNPRTAEVLAMRGLVDAVAARAIPPDGAGAHFAGLPVPLDARPWRTRHPDGLLVPQDRLEEVLEERLREQGVTVRRRTALAGLDQDDEGVTVRLDGPDGAQRVRAAYLVACDGGHSTVRTLVGAAFPGRAGTMAAVTADVVLASASPSVPRSAAHISTLQRAGGGYWMLLHPLDGDAGATSGYRVVFGAPGRPAPARDAPVTPDEVAAALSAVHGPETVLGRLRWGTRFSDASRQLTAYRHGRVLFAGDAAHIHPPIGGQGLNLGVQDAVNLGWKLAATVANRAPDGLLDSYHAERHPVAARVLATVRAQGVIMNPAPDADDVRALRDIVADLARLPDGNRHLAGLMTGLAIRYDLGDDDPLVGRRMIDLSLDTADGLTTVSALLRSGRGLLLDLGADLGPATTRAGVDHVPARVVDSPVGTELGAERVLVRPDGYLCWAGSGPDAAPDAALRRWFGAAPGLQQGGPAPIPLQHGHLAAIPARPAP
jgi:2-polyprenyl-6-methoxyphenol hydroxylase-like FAD-dependent oxidoreductase